VSGMYRRCPSTQFCVSESIEIVDLGTGCIPDTELLHSNELRNRMQLLAKGLRRVFLMARFSYNDHQAFSILVNLETLS